MNEFFFVEKNNFMRYKSLKYNDVHIYVLWLEKKWRREIYVKSGRSNSGTNSDDT